MRAAADNPDSGPTFAQLVFGNPIVAVVTVLHADPDGSATLRVDQVYKGDAPEELSYPADDKAVILHAGERILFLGGADTLDFRGTYAQDISADGTIDVRDIPGAPTTLAQLAAYFSPPETDEVSFGRVLNSPNSGRAGALFVGTGVLLVGLALLLQRQSRRRPV